MTTYGLTTTGFYKKDFVTCFNEIVAEYKAKFGNEIKTTGDSVFGNLIGIRAEREAIFWEQVEAVYLSRWIQSASGDALDNACALIAVSRILARYSFVTAILTNNTNSPVTVPVSSLVKQSSTNVLWQTLTEVIIPANDTVEVSLRSVETGPYTAEVGSIDTIVSLVNGWSEVDNEESAVTGRDRETDTELRIRAAFEIVSSKGGVLDAIKNRIRNEVTGVTFVAGKENRTDDTVDGLLPHSYLFVVVGGDDEEVGQMIFSSKPAGIQTNGSIEIEVTDDFGNTQIIKYDRAYDTNIYLVVNITKDNAKFPSNGSDLVKKYLVDYGKNLINGETVINHYLVGSLNLIPGINALTIYQGTSPSPVSSSSTTILASNRANIISSNIVVNIS